MESRDDLAILLRRYDPVPFVSVDRLTKLQEDVLLKTSSSKRDTSFVKSNMQSLVVATFLICFGVFVGQSVSSPYQSYTQTRDVALLLSPWQEFFKQEGR